MSKAEQRLPQYCYCHPNKSRTFRASEGRFLAGRSRFICRDCDAERRRQFNQAEPVQRTSHTAQEQVAHYLARMKYVFLPEFKLGGFSFDFAFPHLKVLLEVDGRIYHRNEPAGEDTPGSREFVAREAGWKVVHVRNGPGLTRRVVAAVVEAVDAGS